jgi:alanine racemase
VKSWVEISRQWLAANYRLLVDAVGAETSVMAVVKADAYGHGADLCAVILAAAGAEWLGVTDAAEGVAVRASLSQAGIQPRILVMSEALGEDAETVVEHGLTPVVSNVEQMEELTRAAGGKASRPFGVHLEVDTGMARQGVSPGGALDEVLQWLSRQSAIRLDGVMTHFASAEIAGSHQTSEQRTCFEQSVGQVVAAGLKPAWVHAGNSSTIDNAADAETATGSLRWLVELARMAGARAMVRSGLALYGYSLPVEREQGYGCVAESRIRSRLQSVMTWKTRVTGVREIEPGTKIGYSGTYTAPHRMRLALLPVGYADGLRRELSTTGAHGGGWVMFGEARAAIVGRVSMNLTIVDVTAIQSVAVGDEAVVLGAGITADDHARLAGTIPYEILCGVKSPRCLR